MKFEKLNENKIRITLSTQDLADKNIDFHSFMSNSQESQNLFIDILDEAEKKVGFITKNYKIRIEALALSDGAFVITITRLSQEIKNKVKSKQHKSLHILSDELTFKFSNFEDFCAFSNFVNTLINPSNIAKNIQLFLYQNTYYLYISNISLSLENLNKLYALAMEFGSYIDNSNLFIKKLNEYGKIMLKHNAIKTCVKFFSYAKK